MKHLTNILFVLNILLFPLFVACEGNEEEDEDLTTTYPVDCQISTRASSGSETTGNMEKIRHLNLFVVNTNGKVEAIIEKDFADTPSLGENTQETILLTAGAKTVYAFANLTDQLLTSAGLKNLKKGDSMPVSTLATATYTFANGAELTNPIPMSNKIALTVGRTVGQKFDVELVRLIAKMEFQFKNETGHLLQLNNIVVSSLTKGQVFLLAQEKDSRPVLPSGSTSEAYTLNLNNQQAAAGATYVHPSFYVNESVVGNDGWFQLKLTTTREGSQKEIRLSLTERSVLQRNDFLKIPIVLTDYKLDIDVRSYPPIGGYPAALVRQGDDYYCSFSGGGPFVLTPSLLKLSTGEDVTKDAVWKVVCNEPVNLFDRNPEFKNGELLGTLNATAKGKALCSVQATVQLSPTVSRTLSYKIYIENNNH